MSITNTLNNSNAAIFNTDNSKVFRGGNETISGTYTNSTGADETLTIGQVFGRIAASGILIRLVAAAADGSKYPVGVYLGEDQTVANGASIPVTLVNKGDVDEDKLIFTAAETLATIVVDRQLRDRLASDTCWMKLRTYTEHTRTDNQ